MRKVYSGFIFLILGVTWAKYGSWESDPNGKEAIWVIFGVWPKSLKCTYGRLGSLLRVVSKKDGMLNTWDEPTWGGLPYASTGVIEDIFRTFRPSEKGGWRRYD